MALGDIDLNLVDNADNGITVSVEKFIMHALYNERQPNANDIALVKLISNVTFNREYQNNRIVQICGQCCAKIIEKCI